MTIYMARRYLPPLWQPCPLRAVFERKCEKSQVTFYEIQVMPSQGLQATTRAAQHKFEGLLELSQLMQAFDTRCSSFQKSSCRLRI